MKRASGLTRTFPNENAPMLKDRYPPLAPARDHAGMLAAGKIFGPTPRFH